MALKYKPTTAKFKGRTKTYYILYLSRDRVRGGKVRWKPHVKRVYISGELLEYKVGRVRKRSGRTVHGVVFVYLNERRGYRRRGFVAERDGKVYEVRAASVPPAKTVVRKVVELPSDARIVKITTKKSEVEPTLMNVA